MTHKKFRSPGIWRAMEFIYKDFLVEEIRLTNGCSTRLYDINGTVVKVENYVHHYDVMMIGKLNDLSDLKKELTDKLGYELDEIQIKNDTNNC